jgi:cytochrome c peroxidase
MLNNSSLKSIPRTLVFLGALSLIALSCQRGQTPTTSSLNRLQTRRALQANPGTTARDIQTFGRHVFNTAQPIPDFSEIPAPPNNPVTQEKVELGFRLWFEPLLSANNKMSCATCHSHLSGFSNGEANAIGVVGQRGKRNVPTTYGSAYIHEAFWDGRAKTLEEQALMPIQDPIEMNEQLPNVIRKLGEVEYYRWKFKEVFNSEITPEGMGQALASFQRALTLAPTPYEQYEQGNANALSPEQKRGMDIFFGKGRCFTCHRGPALTNQTFANIGVGMDKPQPDLGRYNVTRMEWDRGAFKVPTLLNIAKTAPYMHDGSMSTLAEVIEHYDRGGIANDNLDPRIGLLRLSGEEKKSLEAFLHALSAEDNFRVLNKLPGIHLPKPGL